MHPAICWLCKFTRHEQETRIGEGPLQVLDWD